MSKEESEREPNDRRTIILAILIVSSASAIAMLVLFERIPDWAERGQFGDSFGFLNAAFSSLAFAALIYTIVLQRRELRLQRTELALQRQEMKEARGEMQSQTRMQKAHFHAVNAQIRVEAKKAEIEAIRMQSEGTVGGSKSHFEERIMQVVAAIESESKALSQQELP